MQEILGQQGEVAQWRVPIRITLIWDRYFDGIVAPLPSTNENSFAHRGLGLLPERTLSNEMFFEFFI